MLLVTHQISVQHIRMCLCQWLLIVLVIAIMAVDATAIAIDDEQAIRESYSYLTKYRSTAIAAQNLCPLIPTNVVGRTLTLRTHLPKQFNVTMGESSRFKFVDRLYMGGLYKPKTCRARHRVAVIIPFKVNCAKKTDTNVRCRNAFILISNYLRIDWTT